MKYLVAVSGGVDSVALLDMLVAEGTNELVVAHFDHGIRGDSAEDARFAGQLAEKYGLVFEMRREELGHGASEELARQRRYGFLREMAAKHDAKIVTAHHADDIIETVAINLHRGTGWRGLAVLNSPDIARPLLAMPKKTLVAYANAKGLEWHEDSTNQDQRYLRNRLRVRLAVMSPVTKMWLWEYWRRQCELAAEIDNECGRLVEPGLYSRYFFTHIDERSALELLRMVFMREVGVSPTIPQRRRALHAIKVAKVGTICEVAEGTRLRFKRSEFIVERPR